MKERQPIRGWISINVTALRASSDMDTRLTWAYTRAAQAVKLRAFSPGFLNTVYLKPHGVCGTTRIMLRHSKLDTRR
jgi:hypothetical protein